MWSNATGISQNKIRITKLSEKSNGWPIPIIITTHKARKVASGVAIEVWQIANHKVCLDFLFDQVGTHILWKNQALPYILDTLHSIQANIHDHMSIITDDMPSHARWWFPSLSKLAVAWRKKTHCQALCVQRYTVTH